MVRLFVDTGRRRKSIIETCRSGYEQSRADSTQMAPLNRIYHATLRNFRAEDNC